MRYPAALRESAVSAIAPRIVRLVNEVVAGARPARQVTPLFTAHLRGAIQRARPERGGVARIRHLVITSHNDGVYEVVAVCSRADRISALGLQLTRCTDGRWQVTDVAHPGLMPERTARSRNVTSGGRRAHGAPRDGGRGPLRTLSRPNLADPCPTRRVTLHRADAGLG